MKTIYVAGGCFWGVQEYFKRLKGVLATAAGYANGDTANPTYRDLAAHLASHAETVKIDYDEKIISTEKIAEHVLRIVDPYSVDRQGGDVGHQYRTGIYFADSAEGEKIKKYLNSVEGSENFALEVKPLLNFYSAEDYHQDYLAKNPGGYCHVDFSKIRKEELK